MNGIGGRPESEPGAPRRSFLQVLAVVAAAVTVGTLLVAGIFLLAGGSRGDAGPRSELLRGRQGSLALHVPAGWRAQASGERAVLHDEEQQLTLCLELAPAGDPEELSERLAREAGLPAEGWNLERRQEAAVLLHRSDAAGRGGDCDGSPAGMLGVLGVLGAGEPGQRPLLVFRAAGEIERDEARSRIGEVLRGVGSES